MKRISCLLLALVLAVGMAVPAFADTEVYSGGGKITVYPDENKLIEFTGDFSGPFFVAFGDQGQVVWSGIETGTKDFSFDLRPIEDILAQHPDVQFINFSDPPTFVSEATVQLAIPVNDGVNPTLYKMEDDGTIVEVAGAQIVGSKNKKFEFKTTELASHYMISSVALEYKPELLPDPGTTIPVEETTPPVEETTPPPAGGDSPTIEPPDEKSPQTGVFDNLYIGAIALGVALLGGAVVLKKKKD